MKTTKKLKLISKKRGPPNDNSDATLGASALFLQVSARHLRKLDSFNDAAASNRIVMTGAFIP